MKYTKEFKLECVLKYKNGEYIQAPIDTNKENFIRFVRLWNKLYDCFGEEGLKHRIQPKSSMEKISMVKEIERGCSCREVALSHGILPSTLLAWYRKYQEEGEEGLKLDGRGRPRKTMKRKKKPDKISSEAETIKALEKRLEYLEAENEYLKKLKALIQKKDK